MCQADTGRPWVPGRSPTGRSSIVLIWYPVPGTCTVSTESREQKHSILTAVQAVYYRRSNRLRSVLKDTNNNTEPNTREKEAEDVLVNSLRLRAQPIQGGSDIGHMAICPMSS